MNVAVTGSIIVCILIDSLQVYLCLDRSNEKERKNEHQASVRK